uniref:Pheromone receptor 2 n=1 Tax=Lygus hesperus TaxID=30085 RepID=A0A0A9VYQ3_LYGHE
MLIALASFCTLLQRLILCCVVLSFTATTVAMTRLLLLLWCCYTGVTTSAMRLHVLTMCCRRFFVCSLSIDAVMTTTAIACICLRCIVLCTVAVIVGVVSCRHAHAEYGVFDPSRKSLQHTLFIQKVRHVFRLSSRFVIGVVLGMTMMTSKLLFAVHIIRPIKVSATEVRILRRTTIPPFMLLCTHVTFRRSCLLAIPLVLFFSLLLLLLLLFRVKALIVFSTLSCIVTHPLTACVVLCFLLLLRITTTVVVLITASSLCMRVIIKASLITVTTIMTTSTGGLTRQAQGCIIGFTQLTKRLRTATSIWVTLFGLCVERFS